MASLPPSKILLILRIYMEMSTEPSLAVDYCQLWYDAAGIK
ncbi:hypothetical protein K661_02869 [Piscirickettsia salmonis LF-89 = ATCC VR-1361]|nr:hypothetical protein K661_02869 [Piscirickettsia salmonis LF-89 = ATCC VR-1361]